MAINYSWDVKTVDVKEIDGNKDTVFNVHWRLKGVDDTNTVKDSEGNDVAAAAWLYGAQELDTEDLSNFKAFADLTTGDVQGWVEAAMGADVVQARKDYINEIIAELVTPTVQTKTIGG
tara:strand:- start:138 stop:494 length:357 start_codon:yes stop_codon:yes gene_type:complete